MSFLQQKNIRLSLFFFFLLFLSGRIGLFLHEFVGHAMFCHLFGGKLTALSLFIFGGGRVHYGYTLTTANLSVSSQLVVHLSGIAVELLFGVLLSMLTVFLKTNRSIKGLFIATSSVLIVHSLFYFVICTYYGSGDGRILFAALQGGIRQTFLFFIFSLTVAGAFLVSYAFSPTIISWTAKDSLKKRVLVIVLCAFSAALFHGALTIGEQVVVKDEIYTELKTSENVRLKRKELSEFIVAFKKKYGREPNPEHVTVVKNELEQKYWQFPIEIPLVIAILFAFLAGFLLSKRKDDNEPSLVLWKDIALLGYFSVMVTVLIIVLNRL